MKYKVAFDPKNDLLTPKETETLALRAEGLSRQQVADAKHRAKATINGQMHSILTKLDADNVVNAIAIAVIKGILRYEQLLCLCLVVTLGFTSLAPSNAYAEDLIDKSPKSDEQPFARYRVRSQLRLKVRVRSGRGGDI
jgi:DNA-binding CsgD family transcriptional regulator